MFLLMLSGGALAAAGSNWLLDWLVWADGAVFLVVSVLFGPGAARPQAQAEFRQGLPEPVKALEGKRALVLDRAARHEGRSNGWRDLDRATAERR